MSSLTSIVDLVRARPKPERVGLLIMTALGAVMCFVPLFNLLGYEASLLAGGVVGFVSMVLTDFALMQEEHRPLDPEWEGASRWFWETLLWRMTLVLPGLLLLSLNALRVPNCDFTTGLGFWALGPLLSVCIGHTLAWVLAALLKPGKRRLALGVALVLINALLMGLHIALEPPITGHQWFIGYLSGSIYDEALSVPSSLIYYRFTLTLGALGLIFGIEALRLHRARPRGGWRMWAALAITLILSWGALTSQEQRFGVKIDRETIAERLGGRLETEHFIIYHAQDPQLSEQLDLLAQDHEFRYSEMQRYFGTDPVKAHGRKVRSFVYASRGQKGALMGASRTLIAKIWLREMHITWSDYGDHLLAHELAHIFTEPFGHGPLKLSARLGVFVNMGLVEGVATAADNAPGELSLHEASAAMRALKIAPDIRGLVGAKGFWGQSSSRAYTLMGSFVSFLVERDGIDKFKQAYGTADFEGAYGVSADTLVTQWEAMLDAMPTSKDPRVMDLARFRYTRPSIFGKVCARAQAQLRERAWTAYAAGAMPEGIKLLEQVVANDATGSSEDQIGLLDMLTQARRFDQAQLKIEQLLKDESLAPTQRAQIFQLRADMAWLKGQLADARADYTRCLELGVPDTTRRMLSVKRDALERAPHERDLARAYLLERLDAQVALAFPLMWSNQTPDDALASYLTGRGLYNGRRWAEALPYLERATTGLKDPVLVQESALLVAVTLTHLRELDKAQERFTMLAALEDRRISALAREWLDRVAFIRRQPKPKE